MKKYYFKKEAKAEPMTLGEAEKKGFAFSKEPMDKEAEAIDGYHIEYDNGVHSWMTKEEFKKEFVCVETLLDKLYYKLSEVQNEQNKLQNFFDTDMYKFVLSKQEKTLLEAQFGAMLSYSSILIERIRVAESKMNK